MAESAGEALDEAITRMAENATTPEELLTLTKAYKHLASATEDEKSTEEEDPNVKHPIHQTNMIDCLDVGTSFWASDGLRPGFRPGGYDGSRT